MLVDRGRLQAALNDYPLRNKLIAELHDTPNNDALRNYKFILAVWLGSGVTIEKMRGEYFFIYYKEYVYPGCFCILALDKEISAKPDEELKLCREKIFDIYNNKYGMIEEKNGFALYREIRELILNISSQNKKIREICLAEIERAFVEFDPVYGPLPLSTTTKVRNDKLTNLGVKVNKIITGACDRFPFHNYPFFFGVKTCDARKVFLQNQDGVILDGLELSKNVDYEDVVVLALIGHFAAEHRYITNSAEDIAEFFGAKVVFPNHRNYTLFSREFAGTVAEFADDIVCFAKHYHQQNKRVVLYGMCGGAMHMISAAVKLAAVNIPFKIILDRSTHKYVNFFELSTLLLWLKCKEAYDFPLFTIAFFGNPLLRLILTLSKTNINFTKQLATINENDILTLQGKDKKGSKFIDAYIPNQNATRSFFKERRHAHRQVLKKLIALTDAIAQKNLGDEALYQHLSMLFTLMLYLIDNEKITLSSLNVSGYKDIHTSCITQMITTKNNLSVKNLIRGFFTKPQNVEYDFSGFLPYSNYIIYISIEQLYPQLSRIQVEQTSNLCESLFILIRANHQYLNYMAHRVENSGYSNYLPIIKQILTSELFSKLHENNVRPRLA